MISSNLFMAIFYVKIITEVCYSAQHLWNWCVK